MLDYGNHQPRTQSKEILPVIVKELIDIKKGDPSKRFQHEAQLFQRVYQETGEVVFTYSENDVTGLKKQGMSTNSIVEGIQKKLVAQTKDVLNTTDPVGLQHSIPAGTAGIDQATSYLTGIAPVINAFVGTVNIPSYVNVTSMISQNPFIREMSVPVVTPTNLGDGVVSEADGTVHNTIGTQINSILLKYVSFTTKLDADIFTMNRYGAVVKQNYLSDLTNHAMTDLQIKKQALLFGGSEVFTGVNDATGLINSVVSPDKTAFLPLPLSDPSKSLVDIAGEILKILIDASKKSGYSLPSTRLLIPEDEWMVIASKVSTAGQGTGVQLFSSQGAISFVSLLASGTFSDFAKANNILGDDVQILPYNTKYYKGTGKPPYIAYSLSNYAVLMDEQIPPMVVGSISPFGNNITSDGGFSATQTCIMNCSGAVITNSNAHQRYFVA